MDESREQLLAIRRTVHLVGRLSDGLLKVGPFRLGAEAALAWIPVVGEAYGSVAAVFLLAQGVRARVPWPTLVICAALMFGRSLIVAAPIAGPLAADALALHGLSARLIIRAIDARLERDSPPVRSVRPTWRRRRLPALSAAA